MIYQLKAIALTVFILQGCDSGGGSATDSDITFPTTPTPTNGSQPINNETLSKASTLLNQASFGMNYADIEYAASRTPSQWLDEQFELPLFYLTPIVNHIEPVNDGRSDDNLVVDYYLISRFAWWTNAIKAKDILRQKVAFALSQIFVISDRIDELSDNPHSISSYYDMLLDNSFGNFRALLEDVTFHPAMGIYLSHLGNSKTNEEEGRFPDENYAREIMQLFSIGLYELNLDGSRKLDDKGNFIATYNSEHIREFAKVFTGFGVPTDDPEDVFNGFFEPADINFHQAMLLNDDFHERGEKRLLNGLILSDGQTAEQDINDALDNLFNHPNVGPFISLRLIQRLVTSNPSPKYISRIAATFNDNGFGIRGDMKAIIKAILLDPEAQQHSGRIREPALRYLALLRQFNAESPTDIFSEHGDVLEFTIIQHPMSARSVFNFYMPGYIPPGVLQQENLKSPEMQIITDNTIIAMSNLVYTQTIDEYPLDTHNEYGEVNLDLSTLIELADKTDSLLDRLDLMLTQNTLTSSTREIVTRMIEQLEDPEERARLALYLILISPDYAASI